MSVQVNSLIQKYNVPGPRYTSYPTVPYWEEQNFSLEQWKQTLKKSFDESNQSEGISLYIHLPFAKACVPFVVAIRESQKNMKWNSLIFRRY